jgi:AcrR family transcriptional regulator
MSFLEAGPYMTSSLKSPPIERIGVIARLRPHGGKDSDWGGGHRNDKQFSGRSTAVKAKTSETGAPTESRKRDPERTRNALIKAGLKEFSQKGFLGARIEQIAAGAKCNIRMLYHYFGDKKGLYLAVLESAYADIREQEAKLEIDYDKPLIGMLELLRFTFEYFEANPMFEGLLRNENLMQGRFVSRSRQVPEGAVSRKTLIGDLITSGQAKGIFRDNLDPVQVYVTITALSRFHLSNAYTMSAVLETDLRSKAWRKERLQHCFELLEAYLINPSVKKRIAPANGAADRGGSRRDHSPEKTRSSLRSGTPATPD